MTETFGIRLASIGDAEVIARHRVRMFQDMGLVPAKLLETFLGRSRERLCEMFERGEYIGWLAYNAAPDQVIAGAGVQLRRVLPHPADDRSGLAEGRQALIVNVFTEPEWRHRGLGTMLVEAIIRWARAEKIDRLLLHASAQGRSLYEQLGFVPTTEMKFVGRSTASLSHQE